MEFRAADIAAAVGGTLSGSDVAVDGAGFDSRLIRPGQLFVPFRGERDGHDYIGAAREGGAVATFSSRGAIDGLATIEVADVEIAFSLLGAYARGRLPNRVAGITGSVGKTSTKDLAAAVLARRYVTTANEKSFNNELGVPLTLVNAVTDTEVAIVEMGARDDGHIAELCAIARPTVAIVTAIEIAHSEFMGGLDDIARAKGELVESLPANGVAILNAENPRVAAMASRTSARTITFGLSDGDVRASNVVVGDDLRAQFQLESEWGTAAVHLGVRGAHHVSNALAAASLALLWDVPMADVVDGLEQAALSPWRMELHVAPSGARILNDAYNAGPASMEAALRSLAQLPATRHYAVLGPMAELGDQSAESHAYVASVAKELGIHLIAFGTDGYSASAQQTVSTIDEAVAALGSLDANDAVLVKGSRVAGLERLATALLAG
ncbi:MAG: UDP-N-acetylmuramoyl-tripeptide--D-alanyl-D-alanine ligase [Actinobacteria bacterium]|nr:UDP-N-acetylmuramoyl-tripeptide--D-alanyl-D-alanine ligase [Actinomycetota bacterium]